MTAPAICICAAFFIVGGMSAVLAIGLLLRWLFAGAMRAVRGLGQ